MPLYPNAEVGAQIARLAVDSSTASGTFAALLSLTVDVPLDGVLQVLASFSARNSTANNSANFRLQVDGVTYGAGNATSTTANVEDAGTIANLISGLSEGSHTVELQWRRDPGGTASCNPVSRPDMAHCHLIAFVVPRG